MTYAQKWASKNSAPIASAAGSVRAGEQPGVPARAVSRRVFVEHPRSVALQAVDPGATPATAGGARCGDPVEVMKAIGDVFQDERPVAARTHRPGSLALPRLDLDGES